MENEDYELLPHNELLELKDELKKLKSKPGSKNSKLDNVSIDNLNSSIHKLMMIFKDASKDLKNENNEERHLSSKIDDAVEKMDMVIYQNEKIAEGIITIAEMLGKGSQKNDELETPKYKETQTTEQDSDSTILGIPVLGSAPANTLQPVPSSDGESSDVPLNQKISSPIQQSQPAPKEGLSNIPLDFNTPPNLGSAPPDQAPPSIDPINTPPNPSFKPFDTSAQKPGLTGAPMSFQSLGSMPPPPTPPVNSISALPTPDFTKAGASKKTGFLDMVKDSFHK